MRASLFFSSFSRRRSALDFTGTKPVNSSSAGAAAAATAGCCSLCCDWPLGSMPPRACAPPAPRATAGCWAAAAACAAGCAAACCRDVAVAPDTDAGATDMDGGARTVLWPATLAVEPLAFPGPGTGTSAGRKPDASAEAFAASAAVRGACVNPRAACPCLATLSGLPSTPAGPACVLPGA